MGELTSRQDHLNFYKWLYFELTAPIFDLPFKNRAQIPGLGNSLLFGSFGAG